MVRFQYEPRDTFLHNMNVLANLALLGSLAVITSVWWHTLFLAGLAVIIHYSAWKAKVPQFLMRVPILMAVAKFGGELLAPASGRSIIVWLTQTDPEMFHNFSAEFVTTEIFIITPEGTPFVGYMALTYGTLLYKISDLLKWYLLTVIAMIIVYTVNPTHMFQLMMQFHVPYMTVFILMAVYRFFPLVGDSITNIMNAQRLRGWKLKSRNPLTLFKRSLPLVYPLARDFIRMMQTVTVSAANRSFGSSKIMNPIKPLKFNLIEKIILGVMPALAIILVWLTIQPPWFGSL